MICCFPTSIFPLGPPRPPVPPSPCPVLVVHTRPPPRPTAVLPGFHVAPPPLACRASGSSSAPLSTVVAPTWKQTVPPWPQLSLTPLLLLAFLRRVTLLLSLASLQHASARPAEGTLPCEVTEIKQPPRCGIPPTDAMQNVPTPGEPPARWPVREAGLPLQSRCVTVQSHPVSLTPALAI